MLANLLRWLVALLRLLWEALRGALPALRELIKDLCDRCRRSRIDAARPERERRRSRNKCIPINEPAHKRPDPMIYSQSYLMKLGYAVTWDNPDIQLYRNGSPVSSSQLSPGTEYDVEARIWNTSTEAPVVDMPVRFSYLGFGIGTQSHTIDDSQVTLGVKGGANNPAFAKVKWLTPTVAGHYCIQVLLDWPDDANPNNNLGQENTNVVELHSPTTFQFALRNPTHETLRYRFDVNSYRLPGRRPCRDVEKDTTQVRMRIAAAQVPATHDQHNYPLPEGWGVVLEPEEPELVPGAEQSVRVTVSGPDGFRGRQPININAFNRYGFAGGITFYAEGR